MDKLLSQSSSHPGVMQAHFNDLMIALCQQKSGNAERKNMEPLRSPAHLGAKSEPYLQ